MNETEAVTVIEDSKEVAPVAPMPVGRAFAHETTATQARIDHVAALLSHAYEKASTLQLTPEESAKLTADFPDDSVLTGAGGDANLLYIQHSAIRRRFAQVFGPGQWSLINRRTWLDEQAGFMYADCVLVIRGCYVGEAIGAQRYSQRNPRLNYSDAVEGAQSEALRRIAGKYLDCGIQVWDASYCEKWMHRRLNPNKKEPAPTFKEPAKSPAKSPANSPAKSEATPEHVKRLALRLEPIRTEATEFLRKAGVLMPNEELEDMPVHKCPATKEAFEKLVKDIQAFIDGDQIPGGEAVDVAPEPEKPAPAKPDGCSEVTGKVEAISVKEGSSARGPWRKVSFVMDGKWYGTFDKNLAALVEQSKGTEVRAYYVAGAKGNDLKGLDRI